MMDEQLNIRFQPPGAVEASALTYVIIGARIKDAWIFVRHRERDSWELPAGHIEPGESPNHAAKRELYEETGVVDASLKALCDYTVIAAPPYKSGRIYLASVNQLGTLPESEIAEIKIARHSPVPATYPGAHWQFIQVLENYIQHHQLPF